MERDNKNIIIAVMAILLLASIGGAVYFAQKGPVIIGGQAGVEVCGILPLYTGQLGGSGGSSSSFIAQDICYVVFAYEKESTELCNKIKTPDFKSECYSSLAMKSGNADICDSAPADAKDRCYSQIAEKMGDAGACEKIKLSNDRDNCIGNYASRIGDGALCKKIANVNQRDSCYMNTSRNNPALCNEVSNPNMRQECLRNLER